MTNYFVDNTGQRWNKEDSLPPPPSDDHWYWHYPDQFYQPIRSCAPCPAVLVLGEIENHLKSHSIVMTETIQRFIADLFALSRYGVRFEQLKNNGAHTEASLDIARAVMGVFGPHLAYSNTNDPGPFKNYLIPEALDGSDIVLDKIRTTAANSNQSTNPAGLVQNSKGNWMLPVQYFDPYNLPTDFGIEILDHPAVHFASIQKSTGAVRPFPQLGGYDVPIPIMAKEQVYSPGYRLEHYGGERRPPYYSPTLLQWLMNWTRFSVRALTGTLR